ncbi:CehA/McbA family metallohydrolase [Cohnella zeiphila]|uniref:CehA/McbA family metallohydrolase n=1 Tax=Cohnella zeiphila TaxID=2761120 RepID=A0A7X0SN32_9BACL|nr:CehA/McbA family metallohydrolase [Cohnella zeiphila]MBB6733048.1 CehA/McbA family metallohydrolase [Cohnella zeiphila]
MRWLACELHTHTNHSDGKQTLEELTAGARRLGFDCIALTDHNTMSGLKDRERIESETGLTIIPGMEWTTFYGHMVTVGSMSLAAADWRRATPGNIAEGVAEVHRLGGLAGLAHPYRIGNPVCTGCYWEFEIQDWREIDYIEVWSKTFAPIQADNHRAFGLWTELLNAGVRIAATSGRDWHEQTETDDPLSVTYLGLEERSDEPLTVAAAAMAALGAGRASVTIGPLLTMEVRSEAGRAYGIGEAVPAGANGFEARAQILFSVRQGLWELEPQPFRLLITGSAGTIAERTIEPADGDYALPFPPDASRPLWIRAELWGVVRGASVRIAFTNAIYFD